MIKIILGLVMMSSFSAFAVALDCDQIQQIMASQKKPHIAKKEALQVQLATRNPWPAPNWDMVVKHQLSDEFIAVSSLEKAEIALLEQCNP